MNYEQFLKPLDVLSDCTICPRNCHANRFIRSTGYCKTNASFHIASICIHKGEEPVLSGPRGICNIFFSHCNLRCIYCQNHQISRNCSDNLVPMDLDDVIREITSILDTGINMVGFVSPSHFVPHMKVIIAIIESLGYKPVWVYNSNGYDKAETLKGLESLIDIYLPDMKYLEKDIADEFSDAPDYPEVATKAIKEMFMQKGSALIMNNDGTAASGLIIRHLVLPGKIENSLRVLEFIAENLSPKVHISLMSQYYPTSEVIQHYFLKRRILPEEYQRVTDKMDELGLYRGWIQDFESPDHYRPDFDQDHPFES